MKAILHIILTTLLSTTLFAQEGVQFEAVQISVNSPCNPVIFKGTKRSDYANTAFLMPRLQLAKTSRGTDALEFVKLSSGAHILQLGLYFPKFSIRNNNINYENYSQAECNYQQILNAINHQSSGEQKITRIVTLQIKNIGIEIDGVDGVYKVAKESTSILSYEGQVKKIEIPLTSTTMKDTLARLTSDIGFNINVNFEFLARKSNGYHEMKLDMSKLAEEFKSIVNAQANIPMEQVKLTPAQVHGALGMAIKTGSANLGGTFYSEEGDNKAFMNMGYQILNNIIQKMGSSLGSYTPASTPLAFDYGDDSEKSENDYEGIGGKGIQYPYPGIGNDHNDSDDEMPNIPKPKRIDGNGISAQVFYQKLKMEKTFSFKMENNSTNSVQTYTTSLLIKKDQDENNRFQITLSSEDEATNSRFDLNEDDEILIYPQYEEIHNISYKDQVTYYSASNLNDPVSFKHFSKLDRMTLQKIEEEQTTGGLIAYSYEKKTTYVKTPMSLFPTPVPTFTRYSWGEVNSIPQAGNIEKKSFQDLLNDEYNLIKNLKIGFIFNKRSPSRIYSLEDLYKISGTFLSIHYDHDRYAFVIKANESLGILRLKSTKKTVTKSFSPKRHFQDSQTRTLMQNYKDQKINRIYSTQDTKESRPTSISKQVLKIEKVNPFDKLGDDMMEVPVNISSHSNENSIIN